MSSQYQKSLVLALVLLTGAWAGGHNFGLGFILGEPTALDAKYWTSASTAIDFGLGWGLGYNNYYDDRCWDAAYYNRNRAYCNDRGFNGNGSNRYGYRGLHVHADYLFHNFNVIHTSEKFPIYYGPGLNLNFWNQGDTQFGIRGVIGIAWMPQATPIDLFFEIAPVLELIPGTWMDVNAGIGGRFYF